MSDSDLRAIERQVDIEPQNEELLRALRYKRCQVGRCCGHAIRPTFSINRVDYEHSSTGQYVYCQINFVIHPNQLQEFNDFVRSIDENLFKHATNHTRTDDRVQQSTVETYTVANAI